MLQKSQLYFFFGLLMLMGVSVFLIAQPYLQALVLAAALAVVCYPIYQRLLRKVKYRGLASILILLLVAVIIFVPFSLLGFQVVREATSLYTYLSAHGFQDLQSNAVFSRFLNRFSPETLAQPQDLLKGVLNWLIASAGSLFNGTVTIFLNAVICVLALFYFLKDGERLREWIVAFSPLPNQYDNIILERLTRTVHSVVGGSLLVALLQGLSAGVGLAVLGVPNAVLWGSLTAILSLIPAVGTTTIYLPSVIFLFLTQHTSAGIGLCIWWFVTIMLVDNTLAPRLVNRGAKIHPFTIFIAVLGGISFFGPLGFLVGPLVFSLFFTLLDIYVSFHEERKLKAQN